MIKKKKIVFAINNLGIGGAENLLVEQVKNINLNYFTPYVLTVLPQPKINLVERLPKNITLVEFKFRGFLDIKNLTKLWYFLRQEKIDIVLTNLFYTNVMVRLASILAGIRVILSYEHSVYCDKKRWQIWVDKILALFTRKIIVGSTEVLTFTARQENLPVNKFCLNFNSISSKFGHIKIHRNDVLKTFGLPVDCIYVVTAGRFIEQKGHIFLIEAAKLLHDQGVTNFQVLIFGQGVLKGKLKNEISESKLDSIVKLMDISPMSEILAVGDIFVMPSLWEGLSIALLEAMDAGCPIVATQVSGTRDVIENNKNGLLVKPKNALDLAEGIKELIQDQNKRSFLSKAAKERVKSFSIEKNIKVIEKLILMH